MFGTLTFNQQKVGLAAKLTPYFTFLRKCADAKGVHVKSLIWVLRVECGEKHGRIHYHMLLTGLPEREANKSTCGFFDAVWSQHLDLGMADIRLWDGRDAVSYVTKGNAATTEWASGANTYETLKFASVGRLVMPSHSFLAKWGGGGVPSNDNKRPKLVPRNSDTLQKPVTPRMR